MVLSIVLDIHDEDKDCERVEVFCHDLYIIKNN
jgi:hypothetical protein